MYLAILVVLILLILFLLAIIIFVRRRATVLPAYLQGASGTGKPSTPGFLAACAGNTCAPGLVCDSATFICRRAEGEICTVYEECIAGTFCSGICTTSSAVGGLGESCPCAEGFTCVRTGTQTMCKVAHRGSANKATDCASGLLANGTCLPGHAGIPCHHNDECRSGYCAGDGFCQEKGVVSGTLGAGCAGCLSSQGASCTGEAVCSCVYGAGQPGICVVEKNRLLLPCTQVETCSPTLRCLNTAGEICGQTEDCVCHYSPLLSTAPCMPGMSEDYTTVCRNDKQVICTVDADCQSNTCQGSGGVSLLTLASTREVSAITNYALPAGAGRLHAVFALAEEQCLDIPTAERADNNIADMVYLLSSAGLHVARFSGSSPLWEELLPVSFTSSGTRYTLLSAASNGRLFFVLAKDGEGRSVLYQMNARRQLTRSSLVLPNASASEIAVSPPNDVDEGGDILLQANGNYYLQRDADFSLAFSVENTEYATFYYDREENPDPTVPATCNNPAAKASIRCPSRGNLFVSPRGLAGSYLLGNGLGTAIPGSLFADQYLYSIFQASIYSQVGGLPAARSLFLSRLYDRQQKLLGVVVLLGFANEITSLPLRVSEECLVLSASTGLYVFSARTCR